MSGAELVVAKIGSDGVWEVATPAGIVRLPSPVAPDSVGFLARTGNAQTGYKYIPIVAEGDGSPGGGGFGFGGMMRAIIVGVELVENDRYIYECIRATGIEDPDNWTTLTGAEPVFARNPLEGGDGSHLWSGVSRDNLQGFEPVPLRIGAPVLLARIDGAWYIASTPQSLDGECGGG
jgi:hypothetical protein